MPLQLVRCVSLKSLFIGYDIWAHSSCPVAVDRVSELSFFPIENKVDSDSSVCNPQYILSDEWGTLPVLLVIDILTDIEDTVTTIRLIAVVDLVYLSCFIDLVHGESHILLPTQKIGREEEKSIPIA